MRLLLSQVLWVYTASDEGGNTWEQGYITFELGIAMHAFWMSYEQPLWETLMVAINFI